MCVFVLVMIPRKFSLESSQYRCQVCEKRITAISLTHSLQLPLAIPLPRGGPKIKCTRWSIHTTWSEVWSQSTVHEKTSISVLTRSEIVEFEKGLQIFHGTGFVFPSKISNILTIWIDFLTWSKFYIYGSVLVMMDWFSMHCGFCLLLFNLECSPPRLPVALDCGFVSDFCHIVLVFYANLASDLAFLFPFVVSGMLSSITRIILLEEDVHVQVQGFPLRDSVIALQIIIFNFKTF